MTLEETLHSIKLRLRDQQAKTLSAEQTIRAELDALWACVEVLAQAADGREEIEVPNYFGDPKRRLRGSVFRRRKRPELSDR
jgi:hypothetical protein